MKCTEIKNRLHNFANDSGLDDEFKKAIEIHLAQCQSCSQEFKSLQTMLNLMHQMPVPPKSDLQWQNMQESILLTLHQPASYQNSQTAEKRFLAFPNSAMKKWAIAALIVISTISVGTYLLSVKLEPQNSVSLQDATLPRIVDIQGQAYSHLPSDSGSQKPLDNKKVHLSGNTLSTASKGSLRLQTDNQSFLDIAENSSLYINECSEKNQVFTLKQGMITAKVGKRKAGQLYQIKTPNASCEVIGTRFSLSYQNRSDSQECITTLYVLEGRVLFRISNGTSVLVDSGNSAVANHDSIFSLKTDSEITQNSRSEKPNSVSVKAKLNQTRENAVRISRNKEKQKPDIFSSVSSLIDSGMLNDAIKELRKIHSNHNIPSGIRMAALQKEARCWKMKKDYSQSINILNSILEEANSDELKESALFQIASIHRSEMHDFDAAIKDLQLYISSFPHGIWAEESYFTLGELYHLKKNHVKAVELYRGAIDKYPQSTRIETALYSLARIYSRDLNDCDRASGIYSRIESQFPYGSLAEDALFWKAECLFLHKRITQSIALYQQYLKKYPNGKWVSEAQVRSGFNATAGITK